MYFPAATIATTWQRQTCCHITLLIGAIQHPVLCATAGKSLSAIKLSFLPHPLEHSSSNFPTLHSCCTCPVVLSRLAAGKAAAAAPVASPDPAAAALGFPALQSEQGKV